MKEGFEAIMKITSTGIVRKIDDIGRIVIPLEIRKEFKFREGDSFEIFTTEDGGVYLRKYIVDINLKKK
jgi:AbrB family looped-hinge helix DNA binding protein